MVSADVMEELLAEINICSGAGPAELVRLRDDQRTLLFHVRRDGDDQTHPFPRGCKRDKISTSRYHFRDLR